MTDIQAEVQKCRKCGKCKPVEEFWKRRKGRQGRSLFKALTCETCRAAALAYHHKYYASDPGRREKARQIASAYYRDNREQCLKASAKYQNNHPERHRKSSWVYKIKCAYGLTSERYEDMLLRQGGCCAVCKRPPSERKLSVDHCHATKRIRGLLCHSCNVALGLLKDNVDALASAIEYLKQGGNNAEA